MGVRNCGELGITLQKIIKRLLSNQNLCKLLIYTDKDPLSHENIVDTGILSGKQIRAIPKILPNETSESIVALVVSQGEKDSTNNEFANISIEVFVYTPLEQWIIKDTNLRPFAIIGEIQSSLDKKDVNGLGTLQCKGFQLNSVTDDMSCYVVQFMVSTYA